ncbi:hypothetical protein XELAEV_18046944mg [Xenopus laevis]|uniref:Uncharacterized protein n=1 Tax=Xenopus laevis TaxID=8355 RepID=A0A974H122_XENLA|nr:hypothetical protein XELAEV_18046944mg [Xenopus laevis]
MRKHETCFGDEMFLFWGLLSIRINPYYVGESINAVFVEVWVNKGHLKEKHWVLIIYYGHLQNLLCQILGV